MRRVFFLCFMLVFGFVSGALIGIFTMPYASDAAQLVRVSLSYTDYVPVTTVTEPWTNYEYTTDATKTYTQDYVWTTVPATTTYTVYGYTAWTTQTTGKLVTVRGLMVVKNTTYVVIETVLPEEQLVSFTTYRTTGGGD